LFFLTKVFPDNFRTKLHKGKKGFSYKSFLKSTEKPVQNGLLRKINLQLTGRKRKQKQTTPKLFSIARLPNASNC